MMSVCRAYSLAFLLWVYTIQGQQVPGEPVCTSRYDYEHKVLHSIVTMEIKLQTQQDRLETFARELETENKALKDEIRHIRDTMAGQELTIKSLTDGTQDLYRNLTENCPNQCTSAGDPVMAGYTYKDYLAQATCTALGSSHVTAVRRTCSGSYAACSSVCSLLGSACVNSLHVYGHASIGKDEVGKTGLSVHRYNACGGGCGPNYCCCQR